MWSIVARLPVENRNCSTFGILLSYYPRKNFSITTWIVSDFNIETSLNKKRKSSSVLTGVKHTKTVRPADRCLNRETPGKSGRFGRYVLISHPLCPPSTSFNLYELHISESKIIKTKLLLQSKTESFSQQQCEHRSSGNNTGTQKETQGTLYKVQNDNLSYGDVFSNVFLSHYGFLKLINI